jgi:uncharacterized membrane protein YphA (DoxX/SURF4 family)
MELKTKLTKIIALTSQVVAGLVFVFSGFVKAVDPLGSTYKFTDYFFAFNLPWLEPAAFPMAIALSGLEFIIGICLLFNILKRLANTGALIFMIIFTPLTLWLALTDPVKDCGCFGDAIILTNWQTFYKNVFISGIVIVSFLSRKSTRNHMKPLYQWAAAGTAAIIVTLFSVYNYRHLPLLDFRPYKTGASIPEGMKVPEGAEPNIYEQYYVLRDSSSGKEISLESNQYLSDSTYWRRGTTWKFLSASDPVLKKKGFEPPIHDFSITSEYGEDITQAVLSDTGFCFIVVAYDLQKADINKQAALNYMYRKAVEDNHKFICLTASPSDVTVSFKKSYDIPYDFYLTDPITLKTIVRSNPGVVILRNGIVVSKWHYNDLPEYDAIKRELL